MTEELGELSHTFLKRHQGIRHNPNYQADMEDAVADLFIFAMGFCNSVGISLHDALETTWTKVRQRDWVKYPENGVDK